MWTIQAPDSVFGNRVAALLAFKKNKNKNTEKEGGQGILDAKAAVASRQAQVEGGRVKDALQNLLILLLIFSALFE